MELDDRKLEILKAVIKNYLETGDAARRLEGVDGTAVGGGVGGS